MKHALAALVFYFILLPTCFAFLVFIVAVLGDLFCKLKSKN